MIPIALQEALLAGLLVKEAEALPLAGNFDGKQLSIRQEAFTVIATIYAKELSTDLQQRENFVTFGFVARSPSCIVIAFRGTETIWEWIQDADFLTIPYPFVPHGGDTDDGFTEVYKSLCLDPRSPAQTFVNSLPQRLGSTPQTPVIVCGHSLGAAIASLFALDAVGNNILPSSIKVYTFASPYVGNRQFAETYNATVPNTVCIVNRLDIVTHLPPQASFDYSPNGQPYVLTPKDVRIDIPCQHHLTTYLHLLSRQNASQTGEATIPLDPECQQRPSLLQCCLLCLLKAIRR